MRHRQKARKLGRPAAPRIAMLKNLAISLLQYEKIKTTEAKAKEVKRAVDKIFSIAQKEDILSARRALLAFLHNDQKTVEKLIAVLVPRYDKKKRGGFTRILKIGNRNGDNAPLVQIELV
ncbi:MAG: 50S ribosomal protein L17 [bacterium]